MTRITLIRHGETAWNVNGRWQGQAAIPLNELGHLQAAQTAAFYAPAANEITALYSSDAIRTQQTIRPLAEVIGKPYTTDARLREIDLGDWQGLTLEEVQAWDGERYKAVQADPVNGVRPNGESWKMVWDRAGAAIESIAAANPNGHVLVVSHGGTIRSILRHLQIDDHSIQFITNCSRTILDYDDETRAFTLVAANLSDHLHTEGEDAHAEPSLVPPGLLSFNQGAS